MPLLEDYGTLTGVSVKDRWSTINTIIEFTNYSESDGGAAMTLVTPFLIYPFYWHMKVSRSDTALTLLLNPVLNGKRYFLYINRDKVESPYTTEEYAIDMTSPHNIEAFFVNPPSNAYIYIDGVYRMRMGGIGDGSPDQLVFECPNPPTKVNYYSQRIHRKPYSLIDWYWLEHLKLRVTDPEDRDDPSDWIKQRYPVASFPTEILKPQIDFHISHSHLPKPHPHFPHLHTSSIINITTYLGEEGSAEGLTGVPAMNLLTSLILEALNWAKEDIPVLKDCVASQPVFVHDERNKAWIGKVAVKAEHLVEVF